MNLVLSGCDAWGRPIQPATVGAGGADPVKLALLGGVAPAAIVTGAALLLKASLPLALGLGAGAGVVAYYGLTHMAMTAV